MDNREALISALQKIKETAQANIHNDRGSWSGAWLEVEITEEEEAALANMNIDEHTAR